MKPAQTANLAILALVSLSTAVLVFPIGSRAAAGAVTQCTASGSCTVGEYLYDDEYALITTASCTITSNYPDGSSFLSGVAMTGTAGFYKYAFTTPATTGYYSTQICCTSGSDYLCMDKSFESVTASLSTSDIASAVWGYSGRTLTGFGNLVSDIWGHSSRDVTNLGTVVRDVWTNTTRTLTSSTTTTTDPKLAKQVSEIRLMMEKLVNQPIVQNTIIEEVPDLESKLKNTDKQLGQLYIDYQYVISKTGLTALKWNTLTSQEIAAGIMELGKALDGSILEQMGSLDKAWGWPEVNQSLAQTKAARVSLSSVQAILGTSGKSSAAFTELKTALLNLELTGKLIGDSADLAGKQTAYGRFRQIEKMALAWEDKQARLDKLIAGWTALEEKTAKSKTDEIYREVIVLNQIPKVETALVSKVKKTKNTALALRGVVAANQMFLARGSGSSVSNTWLEEGSVVFKTLVTNPSQLIGQTVPVKYYLPQELKEKDLMEHDPEVEVKYDAEKDQLYVSGEITVPASGTKTISVRVQDIWQISQTEVESIRKQVTELSRPLEKTAFFAQGITLSSDINASLDKALSLEQAAVTPEQKIKAHREATIEILAAQTKLTSLQELVTQAGAAGNLFGFVGGAQAMAVWGTIIIVIAGFVFLALYMRTIANSGVTTKAVEVKTKEAPKKPFHMKWMVLHAFLFGFVSSIATAVVVRQIMQKPEQAPIAAISPIPATVLAAETGKGGPDLVMISVPAGSAVNLRFEPSLTASISGRLKISQTVTRLDQNEDWIQTDKGWISKKFVIEAPVETEEARPLEVVIGQTPTGWQRVRQKPEGVEIAKVNTGERYELLDQTSGWWKIRIDGDLVGWVSKQYASQDGVVEEVD